MQNKVFIKEIFESIQGEGPYIGVDQLFIRFSSCNLHCAYCDTDFKTDLKEYNMDALIDEINKYENIHSVSLTGGEPLIEYDFLSVLLKKVNKKIYLETNGTLYENLETVIDYIDIVSMDIKLPSTTKMRPHWDEHAKFIEIAKEKELFLKVVFDTNITEDEINKTVSLAEKYNILIVLQPKMDGEYLNLTSDFINDTYYRFLNKYQNVRLIPQVHKFLNVR